MPQFLKLLTGANAPIAAPTAVRRVVTITTVTAANLVDGDKFTIREGNGNFRTFEFDKDGSVGTNNIRIDVSAALNADQVRDAIIAAITPTGGGGLDVTATSGGAATVTITANNPGPDTFIVSENVANAGFIVAVTTAGVFGSASPAIAPTVSLGGIATRYGQSDPLPAVFKAWSTDAAAAVAKTFSARVWGYCPNAKLFLPVGAGASDAVRGVVNGGVVIGEINAADDYIRHAETYKENVHAFSHLCLEVITCANVTMDAGIEFP